MDKLSNVNIDSKIKAKLYDGLKGEKEKISNDIIMLGIVVSNYDEKNNKRIKVRIPIIDDHYFKQGEEQGIDNLPWALPINKRLIDVPEEGSIVLVINFSIFNVNKARIYFDCFDLLNTEDWFDVKTLIENESFKWKEAEKLINRKYDVDNINQQKYKLKGSKKDKRVGIKGKGKNYLLLDEKNIEIVQNKNDSDKETSININDKFLLSAAKEIELLSKKSNEKKKPIFAEDFTDLFNALLNYLSTIESAMKTNPATSTTPGTPSTAGPMAAAISSSFQNLKSQFNLFKNSGISKNILIN